MNSVKVATTETLAEMLGVHKGTVMNWVKGGMPIYEKGGPGKANVFKVKDVIDWLKQRAVYDATGGSVELMTADEAKRRKMAAEAGLQEIELAKKQGLVVELDELERDLSNKFAELRSNMRMIPSRVSMQVLGEPDETKVKAIIMAEIDRALEVLSD
jgi:phage terminase Nu1 subunit (DNA packaging protein)